MQETETEAGAERKQNRRKQEKKIVDVGAKCRVRYEKKYSEEE